MSEQARQVFDIEEQQAKDVLEAIKTIVPVISLIREWGKVEQELEGANKEEMRLEEEIASIGKTLGMLSGTDIINGLAEERNKRCRRYAKIKEKCEKLQTKYDEYEQQVMSYQKYTSLFGVKYVHGIYRALEQNSFDGKDEFLALFFFLHNKEGGIEFYEWSHVKERFEEQLNSILLCDWNAVLAALKANKI